MKSFWRYDKDDSRPDERGAGKEEQNEDEDGEY